LADVPIRDLSASVEARTEPVFRPATVADARLYAQMSLAWRPDEPDDPHAAGHRWAHPPPGYVEERWIIEVDGKPAGYAEHAKHQAGEDPEENGSLFAMLTPPNFTPARYRASFGFLEERAHAAGARIFNADVWEDQDVLAALLVEMGYERDRLSKAWELDLVENRERLLLMAARSAGLMREQGIVINSVADDPDPETWRRAFEAELEAAEDIPRSKPYVPPTFEQFDTWHSGPDSSPRWYFVAKEGERVVGVTSLHFPPVQGNVWTWFTGVVREYRGRGIARAVKLEILKRAIAENVPAVRTDNDETNAPMLHVNEELGYRRIPGTVSYRKMPA
jgi:RimJ/RimL family protein N-acetyltransferase